MKIMQVVNGLPPRLTGGTQVYAGNLSMELARRHQVYVFYSGVDRGRSPYSLLRGERNGAHTIEIALNRGPVGDMLASLVNPRSTYRDDRLEKVFGAVLEDVKPDVVHFQHVLSLSAGLVPLCRQKGIPVVLNLHDYWFACHRIQLLGRGDVPCPGPVPGRSPDCIGCQADFVMVTLSRHARRYLGPLSGILRNKVSVGFLSGLLGLLHRRDVYVRRNSFLLEAARGADVIVTPSAFVRDRFVTFGLSPEKVVVSHNGLDARAFQGLARKESARTRFGVVSGALVAFKGIHVAVEAFRSLGGREAELLVWGAYDSRSPYFRELSRLAEGARVEFRGTFVDVREPYSQIDVLVVPSVCYETFSLVLHEAFWNRIPVIASDMGALPESVKDNVNGLLFEAGNAADLRDQMVRVLDDPGLIARFQGNITRPKTIAEQAEDLEAVYEGLIERKANRGGPQAPGGT